MPDIMKGSVPIILTLHTLITSAAQLTLPDANSAILFGDAAISATCGTPASVRFLNTTGPWQVEIASSITAIRAYFAGVPPTCTRATNIGQPCASSNPHHPGLFSCTYEGANGESVVAADGLRGQVEEELSPSGAALLGLGVYVECPSIDLASAARFAPSTTLKISYAGTPLPFDGVSGADTIPIFLAPPATPPPPSPPPVSATCKGMYEAGMRTNGYATAYNTVIGTIQVYCDQTSYGGGWTRVSNAVKASLSSSEISTFRNSGWHAYTVTGIGSPFTGDNYWLPLKYWQEVLGTSGGEMRSEVRGRANARE